MISDEKNKILNDAVNYIDDDIVSGVLEKIEKKNDRKNNKHARRNRLIGAVVAIAACAVLLALAMPTTTTIINHSDLFNPVGAANSNNLIEYSAERDGSLGLLYEINVDGKSASFIGYGDCKSETVYIASTYEGLPVTAMYNRDFENSVFVPYNQTGLEHVKRVVIPDSVKYVDNVCLCWLPNLESIYYGAGVENIQAFSFTTGYGMKFSKVEVSPNNPYYSDKGNCIVDLRTNALVLGTYKTEIPDDGSVKIIGKNAFGAARRRLASIVIPEGVKVIDSRAFLECEKLERVVLPDSLEIVESNAFRKCDKLKKLEFGTNLKAIGAAVISVDMHTEVYYKGTVKQWEAVIKIPVNSAVVYEIIDGERKKIYSSKDDAAANVFIVNCTDGVSLSDAGVKGKYDWRSFPEYKEYAESQISDERFWFFGPDGLLTEINPSEEDGE